MTGSQGSKQKDHGSGRLVLSDPSSVALLANNFIVKSKFLVDYLQHPEVPEFKRKKRAEEKAKESREAKDASYEDYSWTV